MKKFSRNAHAMLMFTAMALGAIASPAVSQANVFGLPVCPTGLEFDSFAVSQYTSLTTGGSVQANDFCAIQGRDAGVVMRLRNSFGGPFSNFCAIEATDGVAAGMDQNGFMSGSECFTAGYQYGTAQLDIGARQGDSVAVGSECVAQYNRGKNHEESASPRDQRGIYCYNLGVSEHSAR